jgi:hypothetical protein
MTTPTPFDFEEATSGRIVDPSTTHTPVPVTALDDEKVEEGGLLAAVKQRPKRMIMGLVGLMGFIGIVAIIGVSVGGSRDTQMGSSDTSVDVVGTTNVDFSIIEPVSSPDAALESNTPSVKIDTNTPTTPTPTTPEPTTTSRPQSTSASTTLPPTPAPTPAPTPVPTPAPTPAPTLAPAYAPAGSLWQGQYKFINNIPHYCGGSASVTYFHPGCGVGGCRYDLAQGASSHVFGPFKSWPNALGVQENVFGKCSYMGTAQKCFFTDGWVDQYCYNFNVDGNCAAIIKNDCPYPVKSPGYGESPAPDGSTRYSIFGSIDASGVCVLTINSLENPQKTLPNICSSSL